MQARGTLIASFFTWSMNLVSQQFLICYEKLMSVTPGRPKKVSHMAFNIVKQKYENQNTVSSTSLYLHKQSKLGQITKY